MHSLLLVLGCAADSEPLEVPVQWVLEPDPEPVQRAPARRTRALRLEAEWGAGRPVCEPPCAVIPVASVEGTTATSGHPSEAAIDADLATAWCGARGVRDQLLVRFDGPFDVQAVVLGARSVGAVELISSEWDQAAISLGEPSGGDPPWVTLDFTEVEYMNLEIRRLRDEDRPCIDEIAFTGVPSR